MSKKPFRAHFVALTLGISLITPTMAEGATSGSRAESGSQGVQWLTNLVGGFLSNSWSGLSGLFADFGLANDDNGVARDFGLANDDNGLVAPEAPPTSL